MDANRRVYLLRHAKSDWADPGVPDHLRPLAPRGLRAVDALRRHVADRQVRLDLVLCSPAVRTRQTWAGVSAGVTGDPQTRFVDALYGATSDTLLHHVHAVDPDVRAVLLVGHNPGIGDLATGLADDRDGDPGHLLRGGFPTGGLASFEVDTDWADLVWGRARLTGLVRPRALPDP